MALEIDGKTFETDEEGYLVNLSDWSEDLANEMAKSDKRVKVTLECTECKRRNYITMKSKVNDRERLEMMKYCPGGRKHTLHKETR